MSDNIVIRAEGLGKKYTIGHQAEREKHTTLREMATRTAKGLIRSARDMAKGKPIVVGDTLEEFWALKDIDFEIKRGDIVGIIGRNGAGKSTLLKVLSRITDPTKGRVEFNGRIASLLEVGTGFHPELTGRENVFLNGAILGMSRTEIQRKFAEIVDFAEVEQFLDTPIKRYSSGMYVRLAFAVAAHLEPEILIVDEVLAVGDSTFQKKCLGKMDEVSKTGRTVLFVSHNMPAVLSLCNGGIVLDRGKCHFQGSARDAVGKYLDMTASLHEGQLSDRVDRKGNKKITFTAFELRDARGRQTESAELGQKVSFIIHYTSNEKYRLRNVNIAIGVCGKLNEKLFYLSTDIKEEAFTSLPSSGKIVCNVEQICLQPGTYSLNLFATVNGDIADWVQDAVKFAVSPFDYYGTGKLPPAKQGSYIVGHGWSFED